MPETDTPPRRPALRRLPWVAYLLALHLLLAACVLRSDLWQYDLGPRLGLAPPPPNPHWQAMRAYQAWMEGSVPAGASIFLGDSLTQSLAAAAVAPCAVNYGIGGQTSTQLLQALPGYRSLERAGLIVLTIGSNDILLRDDAALPARLQALAAALPPGPALLWNTVPPLAQHRADPARVERANAAVRRLCAQRRGCVLLEAAQALGDPTGHPAAGMLLDDGVHLSDRGYAAWMAAMRAALPPRVRDDPPGTRARYGLACVNPLALQSTPGGSSTK